MSGPPRCNNKNGAQNALSSSLILLVLLLLAIAQVQEFLWLLERTPSATVATQSAVRYADQRDNLSEVFGLYFLRLPRTISDICKVRLIRTNIRSSQRSHIFLTSSGNTWPSFLFSTKSQPLKTESERTNL